MRLRTKQPAFHRGESRRRGWYLSCALAKRLQTNAMVANAMVANAMVANAMVANAIVLPGDVSSIGRRESASGPPG